MIPIGSFVRLTGLSAKALRHYHDLGVLVPSDVDPVTGYRAYGVDQIDDAVRIAVLRQADMPLERIGRVLESPDRADDLIATYRAELDAERARVDRALDLASTALSGGGLATERVAPAETFVAVRVPAPALTTGSTDDGLDARVAAAARDARVAVEAIGLHVVGEFWTALEPGTAPAVVAHWRVDTPDLPAALPDAVHGGRLPERTELVARIPIPAQAGDESVQLALAAVLRGSQGRPADPRTLRQTLLGDVVEYAVTLAGDR